MTGDRPTVASGTARHPLPWSIQNGYVSLRGNDYSGDETLPYALQVGSSFAELSAVDVCQLRDRCDQILRAPLRVIVAGGEGYSYNDPDLTVAVHERLDHLRTAHPHPGMQIVSESEPGPAGCAGEQWAATNNVPVLLYPDLAKAVADGGSRFLLVAGPDGADLAQLAYDGHVPIQLIRLLPAADTAPAQPTVKEGQP